MHSFVSTVLSLISSGKRASEKIGHFRGNGNSGNSSTILIPLLIDMFSDLLQDELLPYFLGRNGSRKNGRKNLMQKPLVL